MDITSHTEGTTAALALDGKLTVQTAPELETAISQLGEDVANVDIDLTAVDYVSSAGLRVLVATDKLAHSRGGALRLLHPQDDVYEVFDMTGLTGMFAIER